MGFYPVADINKRYYSNRSWIDCEQVENIIIVLNEIQCWIFGTRQFHNNRQFLRKEERSRKVHRLEEPQWMVPQFSYTKITLKA
jgi:hypothetical protein